MATHPQDMRNSFGDSRPSELTRSTDAVPVAAPPARPSTRVPGVAGVFPKHNNRRHRGIYATEMSDIDGIFVKYSIVLHGVSAVRRGALRDLFLPLRCAFHASWRGRRASLHFVRTCGRAMPSHRRLERRTQHNCQGSGALLSAVSRGCGCLHRSIAAVSTAKPPPVREGEPATAIADQVGATQRAHCDSSVGLVEVAWETPSVRGWRASHLNQPEMPCAPTAL